MYTVEYTDGYYIAKDGEGVIDLADSEDSIFAEFVCAALNSAEGFSRVCNCKKAIAFLTHPRWNECVKCHGRERMTE